MPDSLIVLLTAMTPIGELRASVPLGIVSYDMSWPLVLVLSLAGNALPVPIVLAGLRTVGSRVERWDNAIGAFLRWRSHQVEERWGARVQRYGFWSIVLIVAIPLPLTGAWTGTLAVWALRVPAARGLTAIALGIAVAGMIVTGLTLAGVGIIKLT